MLSGKEYPDHNVNHQGWLLIKYVVLEWKGACCRESSTL